MDKQLILTTVNSVMMLVVMALMGFAGGKTGIIDDTSSNRISKIMLNIAMPMLAIKGYFVAFDSNTLSEILWCYLCSFVAGVVIFAIGFLLLNPKKNPRFAEEFCGSGFPNCGVIGIALGSMIIGSKASLYGASFLTINSFFMWIGAPLVLSGKFDIKSVKKILISPVMISVYVGLIIYFTRVPVPVFVQNAVTQMGNSVGPLAMLVTGAMMAKTDLKKVLSAIRVYWMSAIRLIIQPLVFVAFLKLVPIPSDVALACLIFFACPTATAIVILCEASGKDSRYEAVITTMTTILSIVTLPLIVAIYSMF